MKPKLTNLEFYKTLYPEEKRGIWTRAWDKTSHISQHHIQVYPGFDKYRAKGRYTLGLMSRIEILSTLVFFLADHGFTVDEAMKEYKKYKECRNAEQSRNRSDDGGPGQSKAYKGNSKSNGNVSGFIKPRLEKPPKPYR